MKQVVYLSLVLLGFTAGKQEGIMGDMGKKWTDAAGNHAEVFSDTSKALKFLDSIPVSFLTGKFDPAAHPRFVRLQAPAAGGSAVGAYLQAECLAAFERMRTDAAKEGVKLVILSATRNFARQQTIWEAKWTGARQVNGGNLSLTVPDPRKRALTILRYSSMPGTSRHHWGTDMDLNAFDNAYFASGTGLKVYQWLQAHAAEYGFCQPYTAKGPDRPDGYEEEKWHWSYEPLSRPYLVAYAAKVQPADIQGFAGAEVAADIEVIKKYVFGVNTACF